MFKLYEMKNGEVESVEFLPNFEDLKQHLINTDYFSWIKDNEPDAALPKFEDADDLSDVKSIFDEYDYTWWRLDVDIVEDDKTSESQI